MLNVPQKVAHVYRYKWRASRACRSLSSLSRQLQLPWSLFLSANSVPVGVLLEAVSGSNQLAKEVM